MYYPVGWPRLLRLPQVGAEAPLRVAANRDRILVAILTSDSILIWYAKPCVPIISHRRSPQSVAELGDNLLVCWRPDSSMIAVATTGGHLIYYNLVVLTEVKTLYDQEDPTNSALRRESAELYFKENVPPLVFSQAFEVPVPGGITDITGIRDELMIATKDGHILRYLWDGQLSRDYCLDLRRVPFCVDQQVLRAVPLVDDVHVSSLSFSPLLGGFAIILNDGRAAFLVAATLKFDPNSVQGIWAKDVEDVTCTALNHKYRLMAFGRRNSQGIVYSIDEVTGGLEISHRLLLPTKDYPGCPGPVTSLKWTPDSTTLALVWAGGGFSIWSTFGTMILCSLGWDHGSEVTNNIRQAPYNILDLDWSAEGYQLWAVNACERRFTGEEDPEFCPFPTETGEPGERLPPDNSSHLGNTVVVIPFVKSPLTVNPAMSGSDKLYLQGEDRLYLNTAEGKVGEGESKDDEAQSPPPIYTNLHSSATKQWTIVPIPHAYIASSWPIRYTACDPTGGWVAVAGRTGLAHFSASNKRWRLFGNESQEKDFIVTGGLLWWGEFLVIGCYSITTQRDEVRLYPREARLDNAHCSTEQVEAQVLLLNRLGDRLVVYCANSHISLYHLYTEENDKLVARMSKVQDVDATALSIHPACVVSITLTYLRTEARQRSGDRESCEREKEGEKSSLMKGDSASLIMNVCGKLVLIQRERGGGEDINLYSAPTVLAGSCEQVWLPASPSISKPHLTLALWLYCGAAGMRVWLPLFPREEEGTHSFMARRIMLHFSLNNVYPLAILFEEAIILGAATDTQLYPAPKNSPASLPYCTLERVSEVYLQQLLRQLIRRNLGHHAWEIAASCSALPYFQHSLELLLHSVLEEEATSKEPIPDALLPSVVDFIRSFPVYRETVVRCTRKTEVALWQYLFAAVGSPRDLFLECLRRRELHTAASYLIILQSLEPTSVARQHATQLFDAALESCSWALAKELVRFLRAIDPDDCEEPASPRPSNLRPPFPSPLSPPHAAGEEDLSLVLGTLVGPRTRSTSTTAAVAKTTATNPPDHPTLARSTSETKPKLRKVSTSSSLNTSKEASADEFFIDVILARHARKLLTGGKLGELGRFAAHLDFHLVTWLRREAGRAGEVGDWGAALGALHNDFCWPWPGGGSGVGEVTRGLEDRLGQLYVDCGNRADSGYVSSSLSLLSEQTVDAMLRVRERPPDTLSVMSEEHDMASVASIQSPTLHSPPMLEPDRTSTEIPAKAEVQLRYLLQLMLEAGCLEWAALVATVLRDAMAVIRIVNAARSASEAALVVRRLHCGFLQLEALPPSSGYRAFLTSIQPQLRSLATFLQASESTSQQSPVGSGSQRGSESLPPSQVQALPCTPSETVVSASLSRASSTARTRSPSPSVLEEEEAEEEGDDAGCVLS